MTGALFSFEHVRVETGDVVRLADATVEIPSGVVTALVGPSGAGKSTLLRCCNRLEAPTRGTVRFRGDDVATLDPLALRRRCGMVMQRPTPFPGTVHDNLRVARPDLPPAAAVAALEQVGLDAAFLEREATELSGGEAQRMCLARTMVTDPEVLLLDEPTSALDPAARHALEDAALALTTRCTAIVWITHDLEQMRRVADHAVVVIAGRVAASGPLDALAASGDPDVLAFLGDELSR